MVERVNFVFLPGFMCDERLFSAQFSGLANVGHACLTSDLTTASSIKEIAANVLAGAPETFVPVGLSMGGIVALEMVRRAPERISHLALLNTTYHADRAGPKRMDQIARVNQGEMDVILRDELKPSYLAESNRTAERLNLLTQMAADLGEEVFIRQSTALMGRPSYSGILGTIDCPTLALTGEADQVCPASLHREMASLIPDAELRVLPECGHLSAIEKPQKVTAALLDLISRCPAQISDENSAARTLLERHNYMKEE